ARASIVMNEVTSALQVFIDVFVFLLDTPVLHDLTNRATGTIAQMVPDEAELAFCFIKKRRFYFLAVELAIVLHQIIKICRASDLKKVREVTADFHYPARVAFQRQARFGRGPSDQLHRFFSSERAKKHVGENIEERRVSDELSVTQLLKISRRAGHVSNIVIVGNRPKEGIELQIKRSIGRDRIELVE